MKTFKENKDILISKGIYKNAISTDSTNETVYITIPYGSIKNNGYTKVYKRMHKLNIQRAVKFWNDSIDKTKVLSY
jgi:hypothetical protein